ncbi:MAG: phenylalanine--tRNA ligase subunit alpha [Candidatus Diapherotrites archaeon CG11_big_fil_rev_8_21_14_0_20_37_9]|nr:MAG: phenylalanine--tRNA ligase subunit alpha [Candidatus Diapherotrites archaeon CG11_big_fil_rev_8_21_14_0_20_37_9]
MNINTKIASLSDIEKSALKVLSKEPMTAEAIAEKAGMNTDSARRAINWLAEKGFATINEKSNKKLILSEEGKKALKNGLPETRMITVLSEKGKTTFSEIEKNRFTKQEFNIALGINKRKAFVVIIKEAQPMLELTEVAKEFTGKPDENEIALKEISEKGKTENMEATKTLIERGIVTEKEEKERFVYINDDGDNARSSSEFSTERKYNIFDPVPELSIGKKQPYIQFLNIIRRKLTELGFKEMESPLIVHEFYNFDVLFQPQNHPARTWTDTYQLKNPVKGILKDKEKIKAIKAAHETGGVSASSGWKYNWFEEIAEKVMPAAHGTAHSARQLTKGVTIPGKYFAIARCYRPDVLDATHLIEFNQTEGFIVGEDLNFTHLLGILEQFAKEIAGAKEVKFYPDYYPFTEPSVQLSAKHPKLGWVELGGAGMFRPEILENLGIKGQAIAWGIGIDRLAMFKLGINDIRYLFSDDLNWLRKTPQVK